MLPEQPIGATRRGNDLSHNASRRFLHVPFTADEYEMITMRASIAKVSRSRYVRQAALAVQILRNVSPRERLPHTTRVIACIRTLVRTTPASIAELQAAASELDVYAMELGAMLALVPRPDAGPEFPRAG